VNYLQEYLVDEFVAEYKSGLMSRRDMMRRVLYIVGGVASTATLLTSMGCGPSASSPTAAPAAKSTEPTVVAASSPSPAVVAASPSPSAAPAAARSPLSVPANDPSIEGADITFPGDGGATILAYQAKPRGAGPFPVVLICHENRGLTEHIRDVARRYAKEGYLACAVDLLSREGGTAKIDDPARVPALLSGGQASPADRHVSDFKAAVRYYAAQPSTRPDAVGMTGFCFGGGITWATTTQMPELKAAAPYYGSPPPLAGVPNIKAAVFAVYSSDPNDGANRGKDELEAALKAADVTYQLATYPNTRHAFNNDTGAAYNEEQSLAAWRDVQAWFTRYLKA
jgi:carboxymethylenebutenolidase